VRMVLLALMTAALVPAQETRATILGRLTDASGAVVAGAEVRATNAATGVSALAKSNQSGNYTMPYLIPGIYTVQAELAGFKKFVRESIQVRVNDTVELNIELAVGSMAEAIEVRAETPLLSTAESSLGQVIDQRRVLELPSFGSSPMVLVQLAPGVINSTDLRLAKAGSFSINKNSQFSTDGAGTYNNEFTLDGVSNTQAQGTSARVGFIPPQTAVAEFKVQTASYDASIGHTIGAVVNVSTKAGGNDPHGELHWWVRNRVFDAPTLFQNRSGQKLAVYQDNRYGISGGGPVWIPRLYQGRNRSFWFYAFEGNKFGIPAPFTGTVPTDAMRRGDLSSLLRLGTNYQIYDPATTVAAPGGRFQRQPLAGNLIPANRLDPVAQNLLKHWSPPNQPGTADGRNNFFTNNPAREDTWVHLVRGDHAFHENHRVFLRLNTDFWEEHKNRRFDTEATGIVLNRENQGASFDDVYVFTPTFLMNVRYGITRATFTERRSSQGFDLTSLGFSPRLAALPDKSLATFPNVIVGSLTQLGNWETGDGGNYSMTHSLAATFTKLKGDHNLRFGADYRVYRENLARFPLDTAPQLEYSTAYTRGPLDNSPSPPVGGELAAFLLGVPAGQMARTATLAEQDKYFGVYVQDDYKVATKLTLNLGLRYEVESPVTERFDRSVATFAFGQPSPIQAQAQQNYARNPIPEIPAAAFRVAGGLTFVNTGGNPRAYWRGERNNFMPRFGLAWQLRRATVLRAGYGLFFDTIGVNRSNSIQTGFSQSTPIQASLDNGRTYVATNADPFPGGLLAPLGAAGGLATNLGQGISYFPERRKQPYVQRFSFGLQQALPGQFLAEASYVGSRGTRLGVDRNLNPTPEQYLSRLPVRDTATINFLSQQSPNPFFGVHPIYTQNTSRGALLRPYPQFGNVTVNEPIGYSWYHSLQSRLEKRFSRGYTFQLSYTFSRTLEAVEFLNATDPLPYESASTLDRPHRVVMSGIWELPFGRGRRFGSRWPAPLEFFAGGWQLNGIVQRQSGAPLGFGDVWTLFTGNPDNVKLSKDRRNVDRWFNTDAGFNRNSAQQLASNVRVSPLRFSGLRADGQARWDFSAIKSFRLTERARMQFRAECLNAWNHPNLMGPQTNPTNTSFGAITAQDVPRSWQLSLNLTF